jgi:prevent-host-death family protein
MDRVIGAYEAKSKLPQLLREVEKGSRITITVRGRPVAELSPAKASVPEIHRAIEAMQSFERVEGVSEEELSDWISEGRP